LACRAFVDALAGEDLLRREALLRKLDLLRAELAGPTPSGLGRLLVERVGACLLEVQGAGLRYAQGPTPPQGKGGGLPKGQDLGYAEGRTQPEAKGSALQKCMDRAHQRFLAAVRTLAQVRRLALPVLLAQINVAPHQADIPQRSSGSEAAPRLTAPTHEGK